MGIVVLFFQSNGEFDVTTGLPIFSIPHLSISVSLNVLLTLMIVIQLALHGRKIHTTTGSLAGISGLYKTVSIMLIESCALFTVTSLLVVGALAADNYSPTPNIYIIGDLIVDIFFPILAEIQVHAFPRRPSLGWLSNATMDPTGDRSTAHHSAGRQWERVDGPCYHHWTH